MATIREVIEAFSRRPGVDAVVLVGRDGLPIDSHARNGIDPDNVAALLPSVINGMTQLGQAAGRGEFGTGVLEFGDGLAVVSVLNADALLVVLVQPSTNVGGLLYDLRRHRSAIAGLPVIVLTAEGEERVLDEAQQLGSALLTKPFSPTKLTARIAEMLGDSPPAGPERSEPT